MSHRLQSVRKCTDLIGVKLTWTFSLPRYHQLELMAKILGRPSQTAIDKLRNQQAKEYLEKLSPVPETPLETLFPTADPKALDLLRRLLSFDPDQRPSGFDALSHSYFDEFRQLGLGAEGQPLDMAEFAFEKQKLSSDEMRREFLKEICYYHPEQAAEIMSGTRGGINRPSQVDRFGEMMDAEMVSVLIYTLTRTQIGSLQWESMGLVGKEG